MTGAASIGFSPLAVVIAVGSAFWLYRLWLPAHDRNLARTYYASVLPVTWLWVASVLLFPSRDPEGSQGPVGGVWLHRGIFWFSALVVALLLLAGALQNRRDRKADAQQRAAWNLTRRRRMLTQAQLVVVWIVGGYAAVMAFMLVMGMVIVAVSGGERVNTTTIQIGAVVTVVYSLVIVVAGWVHVRRRPAKIVREDERLRRLDLGIEDEAGDDG